MTIAFALFKFLDLTSPRTLEQDATTSSTDEIGLGGVATTVIFTAVKPDTPTAVISTVKQFVTSASTSPEYAVQTEEKKIDSGSKVFFVSVTVSPSLGAMVIILLVILILTCVLYNRRIRNLSLQNEVVLQTIKQSWDHYQTLNTPSHHHDDGGKTTSSASLDALPSPPPPRDQSPYRKDERAGPSDAVVDVDDDSDPAYVDMRSLRRGDSTKREIDDDGDNDEDDDDGGYVNFPLV